MKEVVISHSGKTTTSKCSKDMYYGIEGGGAAGLITQSDYKGGGFYGLCCKVVTKGNRFCVARDEGLSLKDCLDRLINDKVKVFEFGTYKELFVWIAERL